VQLQVSLPGLEPTLANCRAITDEASLAYYFERFWVAYPRRQAKPEAERAFRAVMAPSRGDPKATIAELNDGLERWIEYWRHEAKPQFIPYPGTWLNQERWNDDPPPIIPSDPGLAALQRVAFRHNALG